MKIVVASGKGGVGKSLIASSLIHLFKFMGVDADVDAPNLHIWLNAKFDESYEISTSSKAKINQEKCINCGICWNTCRFNAIDYSGVKPKVNQFLCEGCNACVVKCPMKAIELVEVKNGRININREIPLISGELYPGETGSGKVVYQLRDKANEIGDLQIIDAAAGISCTVIASIRDTDLAILVVEPTDASLSDLNRVIEVVEHFGVPYYVVINKWDMNPEKAKEIEEIFGERVIGKIRFDRCVFESLTQMRLPTNCDAWKDILNFFNNLKHVLGN